LIREIAKLYGFSVPSMKSDESAAKLIRRSLQRRADREEMDSYQELLKLDDSVNPRGSDS
jgi:hypothetical protein